MERENWVDMAKVMAIALVVFTHINQPSYDAVNFVSLFHVPVFFLVSGYLYKTRRDFMGNFQKLVSSLVVPYFLLNILCVGYEVFFFPKNQPFSFYDFVWIPIRKVLLSETGLPLVGPMWFVAVLFFIRVVLDGLVALLREKHVFCTLNVVAVFAAVVAKIISDSHVEGETVYSVTIVPMSIPFFVMGYDLRTFKLPKLLIERKWLCFCVMMLSLGLFVSCANYEGINMSLLNYGRSIIQFYFCGFVGSMVICTFFMFFNGIRLKFFLESCKGMLLIVGWHFVFISFFTRHVFHIYQFPSLIAAVIGVVTIFCFYPLILFVAKYAPILIGNRK